MLDRKFYNVTGNDCSFLLMSDFGHNRFAGVVNYRQNKRESLHMFIAEQAIQIWHDGRVFVDGNRVELPYIAGGTYMHREGNRVILHNKKGILLDCNLVKNICTIKLSGWYYGRTGGLLGTYDNEPSNDWTTTDWRLVEDWHSFAASWQVGDCHISTEQQQANADVVLKSSVLNRMTWDKEKCADLFLNPNTSLLLPCYASVDPQPYHSVCLQQASTSAASFCQVAAAYAEDCHFNGVEISVPGECVTCLAPMNSPLRGGETVSYHNNAPRSMDIIFVVEQGPCLDQLRFNSIISLIESSLVEAGILGNQYALVGFGGTSKLVEPHVFTSASKVFNDAKGILQAFER